MQGRDKNTPANARSVSRSRGQRDGVMLACPRQDTAGERAPGSRKSILGSVLQRRWEHNMGALAGTRRLKKEQGHDVSAGDFHAGARGREESLGGSDGRYLAGNRTSSLRWGLQTWCLPQPLPSPAPLSCSTTPAVQPRACAVTLPPQPSSTTAPPWPDGTRGGRKRHIPVRG